MPVQGREAARIHATYPVERIREAVAAARAGERDGDILLTGALPDSYRMSASILK